MFSVRGVATPDGLTSQHYGNGPYAYAPGNAAREAGWRCSTLLGRTGNRPSRRVRGVVPACIHCPANGVRPNGDAHATVATTRAEGLDDTGCRRLSIMFMLILQSFCPVTTMAISVHWHP